MAFERVAAVTEIASGKGKVVTVGGREFALFHRDGEFFCLENECPHLQGPLGEGYLEGETVLCPWHFWEFDVRTGACRTVPGDGVTTYPCRVENGGVFVDI